MNSARGLIFTALDRQIHKRDAFECSENVLTQYLRQQATQDVQRNIARVFVGTYQDAPETVLSFYTLSSNSVLLEDLPEAQRKKLPRYPVPVVLIGRLAVDVKYSGQGVGKKTLLSALERSLRASQDIAVWAVIVDAKNDLARAFYERYGFALLSGSSGRLFLTMNTIEKLFK